MSRIMNIILIFCAVVLTSSCVHNQQSDSVKHADVNVIGAMSHSSWQSVKVHNVLNQISSFFTSQNDINQVAKIKYYVVNSKLPFIYSDYRGEIYISKVLFDKKSPYGIENDSVLFGLIAHEVCHVIYEHTNAKENYHPNTNSYLRTWFGAESPYERESFMEWYTEVVADQFALDMIELKGYDCKDFLNYYKKIANYIGAKDDVNMEMELKKLNQRIARIQSFVEPQIYWPNLSIFIFSNINDGVRISDFQLEKIAKDLYQDEYAILLRHIFYWKAAIGEDSNWARRSSNAINYPLLDLDDKPAIDKDTGETLTVTMMFTPLTVNGVPSFLFERSPHLINHLYPTGRNGVFNVH